MSGSDDRMIALLAHMELAIHQGEILGIYLLTENATIFQQETTPNLAINVPCLQDALLHLIKVNPEFSDCVLTYNEYMVVIQQMKELNVKGGKASIPNVAYIVVVLPPMKAFRKKVNDLIRTLMLPFTAHEKKLNPKQPQVDLTKQKKLAEQVLKDLEEL